MPVGPTASFAFDAGDPSWSGEPARATVRDGVLHTAGPTAVLLTDVALDRCAGSEVR